MRLDGIARSGLPAAMPAAKPVAKCSTSDCAQSDARAAGADGSKTTGPASQAIETQDTLELSPEAERAVQGEQSGHEDADQKQVRELKSRDQEVRAHEAAHAAAAGPYASGGPSFTFQTGPDGHQYAIGGEVQIDVAPVDGDPAATIQKMQVVRAAALAPATPSGQDRAVAAAASRQEAAAIAELAKRKTEGADPDEPAHASGSTSASASAQQDSAASEDSPEPFDDSQAGKLLDLIA